jgi:proteasome lid subunit RPN8/RPN11
MGRPLLERPHATTPCDVYVPGPVLAQLNGHARTAYPSECCGALVGRAGRGEARARRDVLGAVPLDNAWAPDGGSRRQRYLIASSDLRSVERESEEEGLEVLGFYHSHPDAPPLPSRFDREHAWPWYVYLIVSVGRDAVGPMKAWRLAEDRSRFEEHSVVIAPESQ